MASDPFATAAAPLRDSDRIFVAGHRGMVGAGVVRALQAHGFQPLILRSRDELDLTDAAAVSRFFREQRPDVVIVAAARVGGILANSQFPVEFMQDNLAIATHVLRAAYENDVRRLLFLGSSCIYPRNAPQPMSESVLLTGPLEETNEAYALAKICGLKLCQYYRLQYGRLFYSAMPTNLYGPGDNYHPQHSHVLPALIRRFHEAKLHEEPEVTVWGTGSPRREFLHVDDLADAVVFLLKIPDPPDWINVGTGEDVTIAELAAIVRETIGYPGTLRWDTSKPDGTPRKLLDISRIRSLGWQPRITLGDGIRATYQSFLAESAGQSLRG